MISRINLTDNIPDSIINETPISENDTEADDDWCEPLRDNEDNE